MVKTGKICSSNKKEKLEEILAQLNTTNPNLKHNKVSNICYEILKLLIEKERDERKKEDGVRYLYTWAD